jgi:hypothetical protein
VTGIKVAPWARINNLDAPTRTCNVLYRENTDGSHRFIPFIYAVR